MGSEVIGVRASMLTIKHYYPGYIGMDGILWYDPYIGLDSGGHWLGSCSLDPRARDFSCRNLKCTLETTQFNQLLTSRTQLKQVGVKQLCQVNGRIILQIIAINQPALETQWVVMKVHIDFYLPFSWKSEVSRVIALISAKRRLFVVRVHPGNHCSNCVFRG